MRDEHRARGWWVVRADRTDEGKWDVAAQLADGRLWRAILEPTDQLDQAIAAGVEAFIRGDRRYRGQHPTGEPGT